ncbi:hypothetical protein MAR_005874 [Mya arenaria]|uniref:Uncharacterized protein n=1 Tax=Mya arenaria TaxID=6604 RepID=A0ABY7F4N2_MYAAR|nr:hypothetical protein MAR_005874 [Mya arenaria]
MTVLECYRNRIFVFVIWLRSCPTCNILASMFGISVPTVGFQIRSLNTIFYHNLKHLIEWRTMANWREIKGTWTNILWLLGLSMEPLMKFTDWKLSHMNNFTPVTAAIIHLYTYKVSVIAPYTAIQLIRKPILEKVKCRKLNRRIRKYRVGVEHDISKVKTYVNVSTLWRHTRKLLSSSVSTCASLVCSRKQLKLIF